MTSTIYAFGFVSGLATWMLVSWWASRRFVKKEMEDHHREHIRTIEVTQDILRENASYFKRIAEAIESHSIKTVIPEGMVLLPDALTAENGAKGLLIGEFYAEAMCPCCECDGTGSLDADTQCEVCQGDCDVATRFPLSWTTIKAIYKRIVEHYGQQREVMK